MEAAAPPVPRESVRPAAVAPAPSARVAPRSSEPPAWLDEQPFDGEASGGSAISLEDAEAAAEASVVAPVARRPLPADKPAPVHVPTDLGTRWNDVVVQLCAAGAISALAREMAMQAQCLAIETLDGTPVWRLRVEREMLRSPALRDKVQAALAEFLKQPVRLEVEGGGTATDTPAQRAAFSGWMDRIYGEFITRVARGRNLPVERVGEIARGRVWTGVQAKQLGLGDQLGGFYDAVDKAKDMAGLSGEVTLRRMSPTEGALEALQKAMGVSATSARTLAAAAWVFGDPRAQRILDGLAEARLRESGGGAVLAPQALP